MSRAVTEAALYPELILMITVSEKAFRSCPDSTYVTEADIYPDLLYELHLTQSFSEAGLYSERY
jgi:hypothetical protein